LIFVEWIGEHAVAILIGMVHFSRKTTDGLWKDYRHIKNLEASEEPYSLVRTRTDLKDKKFWSLSDRQIC
jgi:hypothetical protein